jgi:threonine dehydrogenase-like Zn-dependent dehydrogenase
MLHRSTMKKLVQDDVRLAAILTTAVTVVGVGMWTLARRRSAIRGPPPPRVGDTDRPALDKAPMGSAGRIDPSFIISHRWPLERAREAYQMWNDKDDDCTKIVLDPARRMVGGPGIEPGTSAL